MVVGGEFRLNAYFCIGYTLESHLYIFLKAFVTTALTVSLPRSMIVCFLEASSTLVSLTQVKPTSVLGAGV